MKQTGSKKTLGILCLSFLVIAFLNSSPVLGLEKPEGAEQQVIKVNVSPHIINIESVRNGEIRIFTDLPYALFLAGGDYILIYVNDSGSIRNIRPTRDSLGNLILKFNMSELRKLDLESNAINTVEVIIVMSSGEEFIGWEEVYIKTKRLSKS